MPATVATATPKMKDAESLSGLEAVRNISPT
jgi:hypothetical protein